MFCMIDEILKVYSKAKGLFYGCVLHLIKISYKVKCLMGWWIEGVTIGKLNLLIYFMFFWQTINHFGEMGGPPLPPPLSRLYFWYL